MPEFRELLLGYHRFRTSGYRDQRRRWDSLAEGQEPPVMIIGCFASVLTPFTALWFHGPIWILAGGLFVGWVGNGIFPMFMGTIPGESLPRASIATAMGVVVGIGEILGGVCGPILAGWVADHTALKIEAPMYLMAGFAVVAGLFALLLKETAPAKLGTAAAAQPIALSRKAA